MKLVSKNIKQAIAGIPTVTIQVDRETRQLTIGIKNFESVPPIVLDRVDILIQKELYKYNLTARQDAAVSSRLLNQQADQLA